MQIKPLNYSEFAECVNRNFRPGVVTNSFVKKDELTLNIENGDITLIEEGSNLFILKKRTGRYVVSFYLNDMSAPLPKLPEHCVAEIPYRARNAGMISACEYFSENGFVCETERIRMTAGTPVISGGKNDSVVYAGPEDFKGVYLTMRSCFSIITGCLPEKDELLSMIKNREILIFKAGGDIAGLLHMRIGAASTEIRHLAVREQYRRMGIGRVLVSRYLSDTGMKSTVWVSKDNEPAIMLYGNAGYSEDGMMSKVYVN